MHLIRWIACGSIVSVLLMSPHSTPFAQPADLQAPGTGLYPTSSRGGGHDRGARCGQPVGGGHRAHERAHGVLTRREKNQRPRLEGGGLLLQPHGLDGQRTN